MRHPIAGCLVALLVLVTSAAAQTSGQPYFPERSDWQHRTPQQAGFDPARLDEAIAFAVANESPLPKDLALAHAQTYAANEPFDALLGPVKERGALNGLIVHRGYVVAEWGETSRVDMTFSVTKTFLTTVVGLAWQKGSDPRRQRQGPRLHARRR